MVRAPVAQAGGLDSVPSGCPISFSFSQLISLCLQNEMITMSALVQVAAITGDLVQVSAITSALVQFGCYHW